MQDALRRHWPEYLIEALFTAVFLFVLGAATTRFAVLAGLADGIGRRALVGLAAGSVLALLIYSPWGRRSGTHLNPAITLAFLRLRKIGRWDALFYVVAQVTGALAGVLLARAVLGQGFEEAPVSWVATLPGPAGEGVAFVAELSIATIAMLAILLAGNHAALQRWTGLLYALLIAMFLTFETPLSGFGMNPARTLASALPSGQWDGAWLYFLAPVLGMQLAVDAWRVITGRREALCAKLSHNVTGRCIFNCQHPDQARALALEVLYSESHSLPSRTSSP